MLSGSSRTCRLVAHASWAAAAFVLLAGEAGAAELHPVREGSSRAGAPTDAAAAFLRTHAGPLRLSGVTLEQRIALTAGGSSTVRFAQRHEGVPVAGACAAVRVGAHGQVVLVMLDVARGLRVDTTPSVSRDEAAVVAAAHTGVRALRAQAARLEILTMGAGAARLVWTVLVATPDGGWRVRVDAQRGSVVERTPLATGVKGRIYPLDPVASPNTEDRTLEDMAPLEPARLTGWEGNLAVANFAGEGMDGLLLEQSLGPNAGEDFLYDPPADPTSPGDPFAQVNAYYHLARSRNYYATTFGLDTTGPGWKLVAAVNVRQGGAPFDGAYFTPLGVGPPWNSPNLLAFGQGAAFDFAYDADALLHELAHYVTHNAVGFNAGPFAMNEYGLSPFSVAIDEGVADYFACSQNDDAVIGAPSLGPMGLARDLRDTSKRCPDDVVGEAHLDGAIVGSLGWSLREALGRTVADDLMWGATALLPYGATLGDFARGVRQGAQDLADAGTLESAQVETVEGLLRDRGLEDCGHEIALPPGESRLTRVFGLDAVGKVLNASCEDLRGLDQSLPGLFHFRTAPGAGAAGVRFTVELEPVAPGALDWALYVRKNAHVSFVVGDPVPSPVVSAFDYAIEHLSTTTGELVIDADSDPPFDPQATYHVVMTHRNCPGVTARFTASAVARGSAPVRDEARLGGGCACGAARGRATGWAWLLALGLFVRCSRRRGGLGVAASHSSG